MLKSKSVRFSDLKVGESFGCWGDVHLNYSSPKWCECIKLSEKDAKEVDGMIFFMRPSEMVQVEL